ncbi:MAG TPA: PfkB family carbohydrate kinase [Methylomirabilota bacterium]|nr:PfkB family carbohydrate kinase [Methylomirabilota bacterium]
MTGDPLYLDAALPPGRPFDVVGLGVNVVNELLVVSRFPEPDSKNDALAVTRQAGGVVASALVACARLGLRTKYVGKVGADDLGVLSREALQKEGIDLHDLVADPAVETRLTFGLIEHGSGRRTLIRSARRPARLRPEEVSSAAVTGGRILHLDGYEGPAAVRAARLAREAGSLVSLDAEDATENHTELFPLADVLIVSHRFAQRLAAAERVPAILDALERFGPRVVGVTLGAAGSVVRHRGRTVEAPGFAVELADTTGAGDVFHGAFLAGLVWGWPLEAALRLANAVAALKCTKLGGQAGIPTLAEARGFLAARGHALPPVPPSNSR